MKTTLYLVRQGMTTGTGRRAGLDRAGVRQAELTRDFLAVRALDACYATAAPAAVETARIIAEPHGLTPCILEEWRERGDGLAVESDADGRRRSIRFPVAESFGQLQERVAAAIDAVLRHHEGHAVLVAADRRAHLAYLAELMHLTAEQAEPMRLDPCGVSMVVRTPERTAIATLNASFHLQGVAA